MRMAVRIRFRSSLVPPYLRKAKSVEELLPWLYLKGHLDRRLQRGAGGPSGAGCRRAFVLHHHATEATWWEEYEGWRKRDLTNKRYVYIWADGVYFTPRLDGDRQCMLVIIGADEYGEKDVLAIMDGFRENADSWCDLLKGLKKRGLTVPPDLAHRRRRARVLDGAARGLSRHARAKMLGPQDGERAGGHAQISARQGEGRSAGHLDG